MKILETANGHLILETINTYFLIFQNPIFIAYLVYFIFRNTLHNLEVFARFSNYYGMILEKIRKEDMDSFTLQIQMLQIRLVML